MGAGPVGHPPHCEGLVGVGVLTWKDREAGGLLFSLSRACPACLCGEKVAVKQARGLATKEEETRVRVRVWCVAVGCCSCRSWACDLQSGRLHMGVGGRESSSNTITFV